MQHPAGEGFVAGYDAASYGDAFADVYDDRFNSLDDDTFSTLVRLAGVGPVLELGVGSGRVAVPLANHGVEVHGVDASAAMVELLRAKAGGDRVHITIGDMGRDLPNGPFSLIYVTVNTFFGLTSAEDQQRCFREVADRLLPGGRFVIEAFVPDPDGPTTSVAVKSMSVDVVRLVATQLDHNSQTAFLQEIELADGQPVRLRPTLIRYATPNQLDVMATAAGLERESRSAGWANEPFDTESPSHVTVWQLTAAAARARNTMRES